MRRSGHAMVENRASDGPELERLPGFAEILAWTDIIAGNLVV